MAGANPMQAQNMLNSTGRPSLLRRRGLDKVCSVLSASLSHPLLSLPLQEWKKVSSPAMFSHEQAMAQLLAYKHLPPSLDPTPKAGHTPSSPNKHL